MKKASKGKKVFAGIAIGLAAVIALYTLFCLIAPPFVYPDFFRQAEAVQTIPGLWGGFVPQGVTKTASGSVLVCGYMQQDAPSRIYRLDPDGSVSELLLRRENGDEYGGHAGGLTAAGDYVYISNASKIFVLDAASVEAAQDGDTLTFLGHFEVPCRSSFCSSDGTMLYVGEYHAPGYDTEDSHRVETADGTAFQAIVFAYRLDPQGEWGVAEATVPAAAYAFCDKVQGFAVTADGRAYLSCSSGLADSKLHCYAVGTPDRTFSTGDAEIPLTVLDETRRIDTLTMPHMSEDLEADGDRLLMGFEAGALKFGAGLLPFSVRSVMALTLESK
ncbi:MAG: hypothetical protein IJP98_02600 [Clostridia bacterium]|nr:hypothetical protein [Clostridia bacterium]